MTYGKELDKFAYKPQRFLGEKEIEFTIIRTYLMD